MIKELSIDDLNLSFNHYVIDLRSPELFALAHFKGAINVPFGSHLIPWARCAVPHNAWMILVASKKEIAESAAEQFQLAGFTILGFLLEDTLTHLSEKEILETLSVTDLISNKKRYIVDVRTEQEWNAGHIHGAHHLELSQFTKGINQIPKNEEIALICGGGNRSSVAASLLQRSGHKCVANVRGGMGAWRQAGLPMVR